MSLTAARHLLSNQSHDASEVNYLWAPIPLLQIVAIILASHSCNALGELMLRPRAQLDRPWA